MQNEEDFANFDPVFTSEPLKHPEMDMSHVAKCAARPHTMHCAPIDDSLFHGFSYSPTKKHSPRL